MVKDHPLPLPKSAPVQSSLQNSTSKLRIPSQGTSTPSSSSSNIHNGGVSTTSTTNKRPKLHDLKTSNHSSSSINNNSNNNSASIHERTSSFDDTKRLVDQFYDFSSNPSTGNLSRQRSGSVNIPGNYYYTKNNGTTDELKSLLDEGVSPYGFDLFKYGGNNGNVGGNDKDDDDDEEMEEEEEEEEMDFGSEDERLQELEDLIIRNYQSNLQNSTFDKDNQDFHKILIELTELKYKVEIFLIKIMENSTKFQNDYKQFKTQLTKFLAYLSIIDQFEKSLSSSRSKLDENKSKLSQLSTEIKINEELKTKQFQMTKIRNKWIFISIGIIIAILILYIIL